MKRRQFTLTLAALATATLAGCAIVPTAPPAASKPRAPRAGSGIALAPPVPMVETVPPAPDADAYWIPGHWQWSGNDYIWSNGHWERARPGMVYQRASWSWNGAAWVFHPGRWVALAPPDYIRPLVVPAAPPAPRIDIITAPHKADEFWMPGYWRWSIGRHVWVPGHWVEPRPGYFWVPGHWLRNGPNWSFSGGFWQRY